MGAAPPDARGHSPVPTGLRGRYLARALGALAAFVVIASLLGLLWIDRRGLLDDSLALSERRASRLKTELEQTLRLTGVVIDGLDARLAAAATPDLAIAAVRRAIADQAPLLRALPLPASVRPVMAGDADAATAAPRWQPLLASADAAGWVVPLLHAAAGNPHGVRAWRVELDQATLVRRFESSRVPEGGSAALFRVEPDGATTLLARAPFDPAEMGRSVRGPLAAALARSPRGHFDALTQLDGVRRLVAYDRVEAGVAPLVVAYGLATDSLMARWRRQLGWASAAVLAVLGLIAAGAWRLDRSLGVQADQRDALERSEREFRALADNLPDVVVRFDRGFRHLYANPQVERATGLPPQAFIGKTNTDLGMPADQVRIWTEALSRVFASGMSERLEFSYPGPQGLRHWESLIAPEAAAAGDPATVLVLSRDITERKDAEAARTSLHRRLAEVLESMSDGFVSLDRNWRYVALNARAGEMLGRAPASLVGKHIWTEFPEGVSQPFHHAYERAMNEGVTVVMDEYYRPWDRWFENRIYPSADGIAIFFTDVTERRRAADELRDREQRLREAQHLARLGSWELDLRSGDLHWSDEVFRIFEVDPARFGASYDAFLDAIHPDDRAAVDRAYRQSLADRSDYVITHRVLLVDGRVKHVQERGRSDFAEDGTPLRSVGTVQDITSRVQAEQALRDSEASHREMFEANPHPMWVYDLETLAFLAVNDAAVRKYGHTRDEFLRMTIKDIRPPEDVPRLLANVGQVAAGDGYDEAGSWRHRTQDGRLLEVEITSHTLQFAGRAGELVLAHDVTRRNEAERTLRDSEMRLRVLFDSSPLPTLAYERSSLRLMAVNDAFTRLYGYSREEALGLCIPDLYPAELRAEMIDLAGRVQGLNHVIGIRHLCKDGHPIDVETRSDDYTLEGRAGRISVIVDVTEQRRAEAERRSAAERFEKLFKSAPEAISVSEIDSGRFQQVNDAFCELFGHAREQVVGRTSVELGLSTDTRGRDAIVAQLRAGETVRGFEGVARRGDGERIDMLFSAERIDFDGRESLLLMFRDISQRKRLEEALRTSEARLSHLLARAPTVIYTARADGDFGATYYSPNLPDLLGWEPNRFVEEPAFWLDHVHPEDVPGLLKSLEDLATRDDLGLEYRFRHADGRWLWMRDQISVLRDAEGKPLEMIGAWIDISARREAEEKVRRLADELEQRVQERTAQLAQSEARYRAIFETVPISISEEDWSGVQRLLRQLRDQGVVDLSSHLAARPELVQDCLRAVKVRRMNRKGLALHETDRPVGDAGLLAFFPVPGAEDQFRDEIEAMWAGQRLFTAKRSLPSASGRPLSLMMTISLPSLDGADGTALVCLVDITEIDRLNAELDASVARLRQVNRELETFTYSVSHDLKAPLRGIDGYSRLLLSEHAAQLDGEGRQFLGHIRQATQQMGVLIDDLLAYSRLERRELVLGSLALADVVESVVAGLRSEISMAKAELDIRVAPALHARGDNQSLAMALRNLVDNAIKFSRHRSPPRITIEADTSGDRVRLSVRDNGVGFDMKFHERIFSIFQRLHRAEDYPGTGIGLAIVRKAVERMEGRVWAQSEPDRGATFTIELPEASSP